MLLEFWRWLIVSTSTATLSDWGSLASITSLFVGAGIFWQVRSVKREFRKRGQIGPLSVKLKEHADETRELLRDFPGNRNLIVERLAVIENTLDSISQILDARQKRAFVKLHDEIQAARRSEKQELSESRVIEILVEIVKTVDVLRKMQEDFTWQI